jgi:Bacteriophage tail sheath protein
MTEQYIHGISVVESNDGARPIRTAASAVIGVVGTAPGAQAAVKAALNTGVEASNNALTWTAVNAGAAGNAISILLKDPNANSQAIGVTVNGSAITVTLATDGTGAITSTAADVITAITNNTAAALLVLPTNTGASTGLSAVTANIIPQLLSGGFDDAFPLDTPVLIAGSAIEAAKLGTTGTLPQALDAILDQGGAVVVVVRVADNVDASILKASIIGGVNSGTGAYTGMQAWLGAKSAIGFQPRVLIAPSFSNDAAVATAMITIADKLRGFAYLDGPNTMDAAAQNYVGKFGSKRAMVIDPWVTSFDVLSASNVTRPVSAIAAGLRAKIDTEKGFWWSMSNQNIKGIIGTTRPVDFKMGDATSRANLLNQNHVTTIIREDGWRMWGSRTTNTTDSIWAFESVTRTADLIADSIQEGLMWAVDRPINANFLDDVATSVNNYIRFLVKIGALVGGQCWVDPDLNTPDQLSQGKVYFKYDFTAPAPAEQIELTAVNVSTYYEGILPKQ